MSLLSGLPASILLSLCGMNEKHKPFVWTKTTDDRKSYDPSGASLIARCRRQCSSAFRLHPYSSVFTLPG
jgi:hypothetical protein